MVKDWTKIQKKYKGLWVALAEDEVTVLGAGQTVQVALKKASEKTSDTPYLVRMPERVVTFIERYVI
jgi:hypothetical protein